MWPQYFSTNYFLTQKVYELSQVQVAFDSISSSSIDFDFPQGGCQQRAQIISLILQKNYAIEHCKIWLFSPAALFENDFRTLFVEDKNKLSPENRVDWNYHTAPAILVKNGDKVETYIIDPAIDKTTPILLTKWFELMGNSGISKYTFSSAESYFFNCKFNTDNELTNIFDGTFFDFMNPVKDNLMMEKGLAVNDMALTIYRKYLKPLIENPTPEDEIKLIDLKEIFGNSTALDLLFSQNMSGYTDNTSHRYVISNYTDIFQEAKVIFNERLVFWTKFSNDLLAL